MVVFTCNHCGESLQKPKVEKHYNFACRNEKFLTCVDCMKDFRGEDYAVHTKCLTEDERYAAKGTFANGIVKKGEVKQESWLEMIKSIIEQENNLKPSIRNLFNSILNYSNVPRKKPKFINFIKSSSGGRVNLKDVEETWDIIEKYKAIQVKPVQTNGEASIINGKEEAEIGDKGAEVDGTQKTSKKSRKNKTEVSTTVNENETTENDVVKIKKDKKKKKKDANEDLNVHLDKLNGEIKSTEENNVQENGIKKKSKKKKLQDSDVSEDVSDPKKSKLDVAINENANESSHVIDPNDVNEKFDFQKKILDILTSKGTLKVNKLEKKVISSYLKQHGLQESSPKIIKKYNKKLKKLTNIEIVDNNVMLKT